MMTNLAKLKGFDIKRLKLLKKMNLVDSVKYNQTKNDLIHKKSAK